MLPRWLSWLLPSVCPGCARDIRGDGPVCAMCWASFRPAEPTPAPEGIRRYHALAAFESPLRELVLSFKYRGKGYLGAALADFMSRGASPWVGEAEILLPIPAPAGRRILRGYHPAEVLACDLGKRLKIPVAARALRRRHGFPSQTSLDRRRRAENAARSFAAGWGISKTAGRRVLIVDDVCTTGATLSACAALLLEAGAVSVDAVVLAQEALSPPRHGPKSAGPAPILDEAVG